MVATSLLSVKGLTVGFGNAAPVVEDVSFDLRPGDVLGALTGEAGFPAAQVGKINVTEFSTYVAVDRDIGRKVASRLSAGRIKGRSVKAQLME